MYCFFALWSVVRENFPNKNQSLIQFICHMTLKSKFVWKRASIGNGAGNGLGVIKSFVRSVYSEIQYSKQKGGGGSKILLLQDFYTAPKYLHA